ncbi:MAG: PrgI family protein [Candidatus Diapherotrites archaeon]
MGYEIPQNLKYEEKIVFGLTLKQFIWVALFGILAAAIFLKTNINFYAKIGLSILFALVGIGFAFLGFFEKLQTLFHFYKTPRSAGYWDKKLDFFVEAKEIQNEAIFLNDGSARAVLQITPLHFSLLSIEEQRAIVARFRDFLNSLDFPVQIVMRTVNLELNEYLASMQKKVADSRKKGMAEQFESFKTFIETTIESKKIKNRLFYLLIPTTRLASKPTMFAKRENINTKEVFGKQLEIRVKICQEKLKRCNLLSKRLTDTELVSFLSAYFEGFIEAQHDYLSTLTTTKEGESNVQKSKNWLDALGKPVLQ